MKFREVTELPIDDPPHIAAMAYLATIAFPEDHAQRDKLIEAFKAKQTQVRAALTERRGPGERYIDDRDVHRILRKAQNIIWHERFPALEVAMGIYVTETTKRDAIQIKIESRVTHACEKIAPYSQQKTKFYERAYQPTVPVMHLVLPFRNYVNEQKESRLPLAHFVWADPTWVVPALNQAERMGSAFIAAGLVQQPDAATRPLPQIRLIPQQ